MTLKRMTYLALLWCFAFGGDASAQTTSEPGSIEPLTIGSLVADADATGPTLLKGQPVSVPVETLDMIAGGPEQWTSPEGLASTLQVLLLLTVLSMAPAVLLMTTCYVRIIIVLGLLRQALGLQSLPPSQVMTSIALFMTLFVMTPVWKRVHEDAIKPYTDPEISIRR